MKFEKFVKKAMPYGKTIEVEGTKYLAFENMAAKLPEWCGDMGVKSKDATIFEDIVSLGIYGENEAELKRAYLPEADSKAKDIIRVFDDGERAVEISNDAFALIERSDMTVIADYDGTSALLVGHRADIEDFEPDLIILDMED